MPKPENYIISSEIFDKMTILDRHDSVLIKITERNEDRQTKSGIYVSSDTDFNPDEHAQRVGVVEWVPESVSLNESEWETDIEIKVGDKVWFDYLMGLNCVCFFVDRVEYKLLKYNDIYIAERDGEKIMLNGYCLFDLVDAEKEESEILELIDSEKKDARYGVGKYMGKPIKKYRSPKFQDDERIVKGDVVVFGMPPILLEDMLHQEFDNGSRLRLSQRKYVLGFINDDGLFPANGCVLIKPNKSDDTTKGGLLLPRSMIKKSEFGNVIDNGDCDWLDPSDRVHFHPSSATYIEFGGDELCLLKQESIDYKLK